MNDPSLGRPLRHQPTSAKSKETAALLWFFLGWAGAHRMYLGNITVGIGYLLLSIFTYMVSFIQFDLSLGAAASWMMLAMALLACGAFILILRRGGPR